MTLRGALPGLLLPPLLFAVLALAGAALVPWRRRVGAWLVAVAALALLALATPMAATLLRGTLEREVGRGAPAVAPAAIVVLGAEVTRGVAGTEVGPLTLERLRAAAALHRQTGLPLLVTGGAIAPGDPPLARLMARSLTEDFRVPARWVEEAARTTGENATNSAAILAAAGIGGAFLVTHGWHMPRAEAEFAAAGIAITPAPVRLDPPPRATPSAFLPRADHLAASWWAIREWAGRAVRRLGL